MKTTIKEFSLGLSVQEIILIVVSILVVFIIAKLCYDRYESRYYNKTDSQIEHKLKHQQ